MIKNSEHLFFLIKSLSKAEKRSFKLFAKQHAKDGKNNYTLLFDAIDRMEAYDHSSLVKSMEGKMLTKNISTIKVQLTELVLRSLRQNTSALKLRVKLMQQMDYLGILFEKGLYSQCKKMLEKAKKMARDDDNYLALDRLAILEFNIALKELKPEDLEHYINVTYPEVKEARKTNDILAEFECLTVQMRLLLLESNAIGGKLTKERLDKIIQHPIMNLPIKEYPVTCQIDYHIIWGHYHYAMDHLSETYFHRKKALDLIEGSSAGERIWLTHARFLLTALTTFKMFDEFDKELKHIKAIINKTPKERRSTTYQAELDMTLNNIRFHRDLDEGNFETISSYLPELESIYKNAVNQIDTNLKMAFCFNLAYAYLGNQNYKKALVWINKILNDSEMKNLRQDIQAFARIMNLCVHYSLRNFDLIPSLIVSTERHLKKEDRYNDLESVFLKFAHKHLTVPFVQAKKEVFEQESDHMLELCTTPEGKIALEYIDLPSWIKSVYKETTMESIVKGE
ncbi:MAG: hypothetical protein JKY09_02965 [Crocinitomicaceae bacterium]|nr:hypothetical protein [Crocinitomicaceae bacterium]